MLSSCHTKRETVFSGWIPTEYKRKAGVGLQSDESHEKITANAMEDLLKLESPDTSASRSVATNIHERLKKNRDPSLLGDLVDFYFKTRSKRTRKILTTLRETHSQVNFFEYYC